MFSSFDDAYIKYARVISRDQSKKPPVKTFKPAQLESAQEVYDIILFDKF